jgi:hypothetical protein
VIAVWLLAATTGAAPRPADAPRDVHAGLNFRTDFGTHPLRVDGGVRFGALDTILVLDPMFFTDGQHDVDLLLDRRFAPRHWSLLFGWRTTAVALAGGHQFQQKSVLGVAGRLPELWEGRLRAQAGLECTILWVNHGADLPTDWISFESGRHVADRINFGLFLRFEHATAF